MDMDLKNRDAIIFSLKNKVDELKKYKKLKQLELNSKNRENKNLKSVLKKYKNELLISRKTKKAQIDKIKNIISYLDIHIKNINNKTLTESIKNQNKLLKKELSILIDDLEHIREELKLLKK